MTATAAAGLLVSCLDDPRKDDKFEKPDACAVESLPPTTLGKTVGAYVTATREMVTAAQAADAALRDACLAVYAEPGLDIVAPVGATTAAAACSPLVDKIKAVNEGQPTPPALNTLPPWVLLQFGTRCTTPAGVEEACLSSCASPCTVQNCEPGRLVGKCLGDCLGTCTTTNTEDGGATCNGNCIGEVPIPQNSGLAALPGASCQGECDGTCAAQFYVGTCEGACAAQFTGRCTGTCHGTCNDQPLPEKDAGSTSDAGGLTPAPGVGDPLPPDNDNPGNCGLGICKGTCSGGATGTCFSRCINYAVDGGANTYSASLAHFSMGQCPPSASVCVGTCRSANGTGAPYAVGPQAAQGTCRGECTARTKPGLNLPEDLSCDGICRPDPNADAADGGAAFCAAGFEPGTERCEGALKCDQNPECANACSAKAALAATCADPLVLEAYSATYPQLYAALKKHGAALGKAAAQLAQVREAYAFIGNRSYGDFVVLEKDAKANDLVFLCADEGAKNSAKANELIGPATQNDPTR